MFVKLLDYKTVTDKDIFLLKLHGEDIEFDAIENNDLSVFFRTCIKYNLLDFMCQKEYRGTLATFKIRQLFRFSMNFEKTPSCRKFTINLFPNDTLNISEILMTHDYYRRPGPDNSQYYIHDLHFDFPRGCRNKFYKNFNYDL